MYYSITPTLYNSYYYFVNSDSNDDTDFLNLLSRVRTPPTQLMLDGIKFEEDVYCAIRTSNMSFDPLITEIAEICKNGVIQYKLSRTLTDNIEVHGIADVVTPTRIYDIKKVKSYSLGKYMNSIQHLIYMFATEINEFEYLICDGSTVYREFYKYNEEEHNKLISNINTMIDFILSTEKYKIPFLKYWTVNYG